VVALATSMMDASRKDVVTAVLGASAGLGGFVLMFLGLLVSTYQSYPADTSKSVKQRHRRAVWPILGVFSLSAVTLALALIWLAAPGGTCLYRVVLTTFAADLAAIVAAAIFTTVRMLR
jgi:hypothetical protein